MQRIGQSLVPRHGGPKRRGSEGRRFFVFCKENGGKGSNLSVFFLGGGRGVV